MLIKSHLLKCQSAKQTETNKIEHIKAKFQSASEFPLYLAINDKIMIEAPITIDYPTSSPFIPAYILILCVQNTRIAQTYAT